MNKTKAYEMIKKYDTVEKVDAALKNSRNLGKSSFQNTMFKLLTIRLTEWLTSEPVSRMITFNMSVLLHILKAVSDVVALEIQTKTYLDLFIRFLKEQEKEFLTLLLSLKTVMLSPVSASNKEG